MINYLSLSLLYSSTPVGRTTLALLHHSGSNTILHPPHTSTEKHKLADIPNALRCARSLAHSLAHSFIPSSCATPVPLCHCLAMPSTNISIFSPACLSRPLGPSHFHSYYALLVFMLARWGDGVIDGGMILCFNNNRRGRSRRQHP